MSGPTAPDIAPSFEPPVDPDELMAGGQGMTPRWRVVLVVLVVLAVGGGIYLARRGPSPTISGSAEVVDGGDLGEHSDAKALSDRLAPQLAAAPDSPEASLAPGSVPCDDSPAALPQDQADLVYSARLDWEGTPAVVLGYRVEGPSLARVLLVMAEADCRLIVTQSF